VITKKHLIDLFNEASCTLSKEEIELFYQFYTIYEQYNKPFDLSRLFSPRDIVEKHFVDSIILRDFIDIPDSILDIGTGPGFPGIPLKIINPQSHIVLGEPRSKRVEFMNIVIDQLGLKGIEVYPHSVTELSTFNVESVITRAVETIDNTLARSLPFLPVNGKAIFLKGPMGLKEIDEISSMNKEHFKHIYTKTYKLPLSRDDRSLIVFEKTSNYKKAVYKIMKNDNENRGMVISSSDNKKFKNFKKILTSEGIKKQKTTLLSGKKIIEELIKNSPQSIDEVILPDGFNEENQIILDFIEEKEKNNKILILKKGLYNEIDLFKTNNIICSIKLSEISQWDQEKTAGCTLLVPFQDPSNLGSVIRSAAGFGVTQIVILKGAANPFHPKSIRSSSGTVLNMKLFSGPNIDEISKISNDKQWPVVPLNMEGQPLESFDFPESFMLIPGVEGPGIPEELKKNAVSILLENNVESLNAAAAASIALYQWKINQSPSKLQR